MADFKGTEDTAFKGKDDVNIYYIDKREDSFSLSGEWRFGFFDSFPEGMLSSEDLPYAASLPSSVYMNMYGAGLLPHPYIDTNSHLYRRLDEKIWYFGRKFTVKKEYEGKKALLCADGISYYCKLWINGIPAVYHEGMFGGPCADITEYLDFGAENEIMIEVLAADYGKKDSFSFWNNEGTNREIVPWNLMHDKATSNGDFTVLGIWNEIRIEFLDKYHMARPYITTESISEDKKTAQIKLEAEICDGTAPSLHGLYGKNEGTFDLSPGGGLASVYKNDSVILKTVITEKSGGKEIYNETEEIKLIDFAASFPYCPYFENQFYEKHIRIDSPKLWEPGCIGKAELYLVTLELYHGDKLCDRQTLNMGIRTVKTERSAGRRFRTAWRGWQFVVNGKRIFIKGMNWMPFDFLYDISEEKYRTYLEMIKNQGVNLIRVWSGGGMPETDAFYDICDELGIMVWQDHFPSNTRSTKGWPIDVLESQEALNIYRIRKHPSLAVHCGGNEINPYTDGNAMALLTSMRFTSMLDPSRIFISTSPDMGSAHIYPDMEPVWYGKIFGELPFLAESGIHSFPSYETLSECITGDIMKKRLDLSKPESLGADPGLLNHFSEFMPERVPRMLARASQMTDLSDTSIKEISCATQMAAYEFYLVMLQSMRRNYPYTAGAMPWVFKRPWPTVGVQLADGFGRPLFQYYAVQNAFKKTAVMLDLDQLTLYKGESFKIRAHVIEDGEEKVPDDAVLRVRVYSPRLEKAYELKKEYRKGTVLTGEFDVPDDYADKFFYVTVSLLSGNMTAAQSTYTPKVTSLLDDEETRRGFREKISPNLYFKNGPWLIPQSENAQRASIEMKTEYEEYRVTATLINKGDIPAFFTRISCTDKEYIFVFDDACFMLEAGEEKTVSGFACKKGKNSLTKADFKAGAYNL